MSFFNKHYSQREHIFYMGWVSECLSLDSSRISLQHSSGWRWLSRFLIVKGGHVYLFQVPPVSILKSYKYKLAHSSRRNNSGSSGSSLGSVVSSASEASNSSNSAHFSSLNMASESNDLMTKSHKVKPDRMDKINRDMEKELAAASTDYLICYKSDFRCVKPNELSDFKKDCFVLNSGTIAKRYFSTENANDLQNLQKAWTRANFHSVTELKVYFFWIFALQTNIQKKYTLSSVTEWKLGITEKKVLNAQQQ